MNSDKFPELERRSMTSLADKFGAMKQHAEHVIAEKVQQMKDEGLAHELTDDEEAMLLAYKRFYAKSKPGSVFQWRTPRVQQGIVTPPDVSLILNPQEV
jgi:hypothetical protein